jgi:hypothetical protein
MRRDSTLDSYYFLADLPANDNTPAALKKPRESDVILRTVPWPQPYDSTEHRMGHIADYEELSNELDKV